MRFRSSFLWFLLFVSAGLLIRSGLGSRLPQADVRFGNQSEPQTLDPAIMSGVPEGRIARALFEGLTYPNLKDLTRPHPGAAQSWTVSPDGMVYTFYLRENGVWSNGKPLTAKHFLFSWRRVLAPNTGSLYTELLWPVKYARAYNQQLFYKTKRTVVFHSSPVDGKKENTTAKRHAILVREDINEKEISGKSIPLLAAPGANTDSKGAHVKRGTIVIVTAKRIIDKTVWYKVHPHSHPKQTGWIRSEHCKPNSKRVKVDGVMWFEVHMLDKPSQKGWVKQSDLTRLNSLFPPKNGESTDAPWRFVGLKVKPITRPLPKGYTEKALGKPLIFEVTLNQPTAYFTQLVSYYTLFPVYPPLVKARPRSWVLPKHFVGNGPFKLTHWMINDLVRVEKNKHYWNAKQIKINSVHFNAVTERDTQLSMYLAGDLDIISNNIPLPTVDKLKGRKDFYSRPYLGSYFYRINTRKPPFNNKWLRKALAWSIDRKSITTYILRGGQLPASGLVPPGISWYPIQPKSGPQFSPEQAKQFLAKAGYPGGKDLPSMSLLYNTDQQHKQIAEAIQKMWQTHLGIKVNLVNKEWKTYLDTTRKGEYQIARAGWIGDYTDPNTFLAMFVTGGGHNRTGWGHSAYDAAILGAERETDPHKRRELFRKAEQILMDDCPIIPIYYYNYQNLINTQLKGHIDNPLNMFDFRLFWRTKEQ